MLIVHHWILNYCFDIHQIKSIICHYMSVLIINASGKHNQAAVQSMIEYRLWNKGSSLQKHGYNLLSGSVQHSDGPLFLRSLWEQCRASYSCRFVNCLSPTRCHLSGSLGPRAMCGGTATCSHVTDPHHATSHGSLALHHTPSFKPLGKHGPALLILQTL